MDNNRRFLFALVGTFRTAIFEFVLPRQFITETWYFVMTYSDIPTFDVS